MLPEGKICEPCAYHTPRTMPVQPKIFLQIFVLSRQPEMLANRLNLPAMPFFSPVMANFRNRVVSVNIPDHLR